MANPSIRLKLDLRTYDEVPFAAHIERVAQKGIKFETLQSLGNTQANHRALYELNKACSADIPGRGAFYDFGRYVTERIERAADDPAGIIIALHDGKWVGMSASSFWPDQDLVFAEMTGVVRDWRRRGLATALKVLALRYALSKGVSRIFTIHHADNTAPIALNRRLGFVDG